VCVVEVQVLELLLRVSRLLNFKRSDPGKKKEKKRIKFENSKITPKSAKQGEERGATTVAVLLSPVTPSVSGLCCQPAVS
jgi:hypothetical protein